MKTIRMEIVEKKYFIYIDDKTYNFDIIGFFDFLSNMDNLDVIISKISIGINTYPNRSEALSHEYIVDAFKFIYEYLCDDCNQIHLELFSNSFKQIIIENSNYQFNTIYDFYVKIYNDFLEHVNLYKILLTAIKRYIYRDNDEEEAMQYLKKNINEVLSLYRVPIKKSKASINNYLQLLYVIVNDILKIKVCGNCGKLFIPKRSDSKFCYNMYLNTEKTCCEYIRASKNKKRNYPPEVKQLDRERAKLYNSNIKINDPIFEEISLRRKKLMEDFRKKVGEKNVLN